MIVHTTKRVPFIIHANVAFEALEPFAVNQIPEKKIVEHIMDSGTFVCFVIQSTSLAAPFSLQ
jgi:hypothetical protein